MPNIFDPTFILVCIALAVAVAALAFAWNLHRKGVANDQLAAQVGLKAGDVFDAGRDRVVTWLHEELAKLAAKATLKDRYFDVDDFLADIGRLPVSYEPTITLTTTDSVESMKRPGSNQVMRYYVQPGSGNVTTSRPPA